MKGQTNVFMRIRQKSVWLVAALIALSVCSRRGEAANVILPEQEYPGYFFVGFNESLFPIPTRFEVMSNSGGDNTLRFMSPAATRENLTELMKQGRKISPEQILVTPIDSCNRILKESWSRQKEVKRYGLTIGEYIYKRDNKLSERYAHSYVAQSTSGCIRAMGMSEADFDRLISIYGKLSENSLPRF